MNLGQIDLSDDQGSGRYTKYQHDLHRLIFLILLMVSFVIGLYVTRTTNQPVRVINRSLKKSLARSFCASLEGTTSVMDSVVSIYRDRQVYTSGKGIVSFSGSEEHTGAVTFSSLSLNAHSALELIRKTTLASEMDRQDMYGHGTRHFSGSLKISGNDSPVVCVYEYWIDLRSFLAVRLSLTLVERNAVPQTDDEPLSRVTYLNIRFYDWR